MASFGFTVATTLYRSLFKSKHLAGVRALTLWMNDSAEDAERASAFLDLLAASPCLSTLEALGLRQRGLRRRSDRAPRHPPPSPSLASLDLSYNRFGAAGVEALTAARWWPALRSLTLDWVRKGSFDRLGDKGLAPMLARLLLHIPWDSLAPTARFDAPRCRALALAHLPGERLACFENLPVEELSLRFGHNGSAALMAPCRRSGGARAPS